MRLRVLGEIWWSTSGEARSGLKTSLTILLLSMPFYTPNWSDLDLILSLETNKSLFCPSHSKTLPLETGISTPGSAGNPIDLIKYPIKNAIWCRNLVKQIPEAQRSALRPKVQTSPDVTTWRPINERGEADEKGKKIKALWAKVDHVLLGNCIRAERKVLDPCEWKEQNNYSVVSDRRYLSETLTTGYKLFSIDSMELVLKLRDMFERKEDDRIKKN